MRRAAAEQAGNRQVVARDVLANFVESSFGSAQPDGRADSQHAELVRKNADQIEIAARALRVNRAMGHLHFAGGVGERAVFFVGRRRGEDDVGALRGFGQEHFVDYEQLEAAEIVGLRRGECFHGIGADYVERFQFPGDGRVHHGARSQTWRGGNFSAPNFSEAGAFAGILKRCITRQTIGEHAHIGSAAGVRVVAERHDFGLAADARRERN